MATPSKRPFARGFATDAATERALRAGLAGKDIQIKRGRLPAALRTLAAEPASSLVFVDLDGISEPEAAARQLSGVCAFDTALVAIGSVDTAQYSRALLQHGVSDYLVKPVTAGTVREAAAALTDDVSEHLYAGEVVAFAGTPGSGTSTLVAALARAIAEDGRAASVVDLDPVSGKLSALLEAEPRDGLASILSLPEPDAGDEPEPRFDPEMLDRIETPAASGISLIGYLSAGPLPPKPALPMLSALFKRLANRTHVVLVTGLADAWNAQGLDMRAELATAIQPVPEPGACAPRPRFLAPAMSYRLHACDPGEMRWLRSLAERAGAPAEEAASEETASRSAPVDEPSAASEVAPEAAPDPTGRGTKEPLGTEPVSDDLALGRELAELQRTADRLASAPAAVPAARPAAGSGPDRESASLDMTALEMQIGADSAPALDFGADPEGSGPDEELARLEDALARLPDTVRRRLGESHGVGVAQATARLRDAGETGSLRAELRATVSGLRVPQWLEDLAATVLADAGAETGSGARTGSLRLDPVEEPEGGYLAIETESGMQGRLAPPGLVRQVHLGLAFARQASTALLVLRTAGAESGWTLDEGPNGGSGLLASERETLDAARQIQRALDRLHEVRGEPHRSRTALEQAAMAAEAMRTVGPTVRAAAGWPGALGAPDPRNPEDVARMAAFAETLHETVRSICDRQIAGGMAVAHGAR